MTDFYRTLSPDERVEYDALIHEAGYDDLGVQYPAHEIKERMHKLLDDAILAGRKWAEYVVDDDAREGHLKRFKSWDRARQVVSTRHGEVVVKRSAVMSVRRRNKTTGRQYWQGVFYPDMTRDDLLEITKGSGSRIASERITIAIARRLIGLLDKTAMTTVAKALEIEGQTLDEFLLAEEAA